MPTLQDIERERLPLGEPLAYQGATLLVLALVGVIAVVDRPAAQLLTSLTLFTLLTTVIAIRLRSRLTADHKPGE